MEFQLYATRGSEPSVQSSIERKIVENYSNSRSIMFFITDSLLASPNSTARKHYFRFSPNPSMYQVF